MSIEQELKRIADVLEKVGGEIATIGTSKPAPTRRKKAVKKAAEKTVEEGEVALTIETTTVEKEDDLGIDLGLDTETEACDPKVYTEEDVRAAAKTLVAASGKGDRGGYIAAQETIAKYADSVHNIKVEEREEVINKLLKRASEWK